MLKVLKFKVLRSTWQLVANFFLLPIPPQINFQFNIFKKSASEGAINLNDRTKP